MYRYTFINVPRPLVDDVAKEIVCRSQFHIESMKFKNGKTQPELAIYAGIILDSDKVTKTYEDFEQIIKEVAEKFELSYAKERQ